VFQRLLPERPTPERCVEAYYLQRTRGSRAAAEWNLTPAGVNCPSTGNVEISGRNLR